MGIQEISATIDQVQTLRHTMNSQLDEFYKNGMPADVRANLDTLNSDITGSISKYNGLIAEQKELALARQRPGYAGNYAYGGHKSESTRAIEKWIRKQGDILALTPEERKLINFNQMDFGPSSPMTQEQKVMTSAAADLGGFFAGSDLSQRFIQKLFLISPVRSLADTQIIGGEKLLLPSEGATDTNIFWSDEQTGLVASPDPNLGMIEIYARELNGYLKLSRQNLEDSVFDIEGYILKRLTRQFAQKEGAAFLTGDGVARPEGILTSVASGVITQVINNSSAGVIKAPDIINLMHATKSGYRPTGTWMMSNNTIGALRLFTDSQARPLWTMFGDVFRETLFGRPIVEMPDMVNPSSYPAGVPTYTVGQYPVIFGDIGQGYQIVDRVGLTFQTLKELFAIQNQVAYLARMRVGGKVVLPEAIAVLKINS